MGETETEVQEELERRDGRAESGGEGRPDKSPRESNRTPRAQRAEVSNYDIVRHYFTLAADRLDIAEDLRAVLSSSYREVQVQIPIRLQDGKIHVYSGYRGSTTALEGPGRGLVYLYREAAPSLDLKPDDTRVVIQGFGNVGSWRPGSCRASDARWSRRPTPSAPCAPTPGSTPTRSPITSVVAGGSPTSRATEPRRSALRSSSRRRARCSSPPRSGA